MRPKPISDGQLQSFSGRLTALGIDQNEVGSQEESLNRQIGCSPSRADLVWRLLHVAQRKAVAVEDFVTLAHNCQAMGDFRTAHGSDAERFYQLAAEWRRKANAS